MVHREDSEGLIVISQPAHSWVSGQLARAWGNAEFGGFEPSVEVCLAAEQHDMGFVEWEKAPTLHAESGRPHQFTNMPTPPHLDLWSLGVANVLVYSRYAALLVSRHVTHLCQNNKLTRDAHDSRALQNFLDEQYALQSKLLGDLRADPVYREHSSAGVLERNTRLVATWDWLSLIFCIGMREPQTMEEVPTAAGAVRLHIEPSPADRTVAVIRPWPFRTEAVTLVCDGRRLPQVFGDAEELRAALREAPVVALAITLRPE